MRKILLALAALAWAVGSASAVQAAPGAVPTQEATDVVLGQPNAPVTIFEYASLTCPHCAEFNVDTLPKLKTNWIDTGKVKLIYRDYPLDQVALRAAMLARCAPPERFYGFIDALFHSQQNWAAASDTRGALARIGRLGGISQEQFDQCTNDQKGADRVVAERLVAQDQYGVDSTPTFFIAGNKMVGSQPYDEFEKVLTTALAQAGGSGSAPVQMPAPAASTPVGSPSAATTPAATVPATTAPATSDATPAPTAASPAPAPAADAPPPAAAPASQAAPVPPKPPAQEEGWMAKIKHMFGY